MAAFFKTNPLAKNCAKQLVERGLLAAPDRNRAFLVERLVNLPFTTHNEAELLIDGEATFRSILAGIDQARTYILIEFYILRDDATGRRLQQRLIAKAREGVAVYMLYDEIGRTNCLRAIRKNSPQRASPSIRSTHARVRRIAGN